MKTRCNILECSIENAENLIKELLDNQKNNNNTSLELDAIQFEEQIPSAPPCPTEGLSSFQISGYTSIYSSL